VSDDELAAEVERDGVAAFIDQWLANPLFAGVPADAPGNVERLTNTAAGLASSLRLAGTGTPASLWNRLSELAHAEFRTQLVTGRDDIKFRTIAARMHAEIGGPAPIEITGAGHCAHLEQPELFVQAVLGFLADS
jgi:2-succinyl-6-hydroxy-2,4-cyclohexadiene-1-carboxylate synthase